MRLPSFPSQRALTDLQVEPWTWLHFAGYHLIGCRKLFNPAVSENIEYIERNIYINSYIFFIFPKFDVLCGLTCEKQQSCVGGDRVNFLTHLRLLKLCACVTHELWVLMAKRDCNCPPKPRSFSQLPSVLYISVSSSYLASLSQRRCELAATCLCFSFFPEYIVKWCFVLVS